MTTIIAYCSSNDKLNVRKLQGSGQPLKLFPPLSGPAIQRLISRLEKDKEALNPTVSKKSETQRNATSSNLIQVKSGFKNEDLDNFIKDLPENSDQQTQKLEDVYLDKGRRAADLRNLQKGYKNKSHMINPQDSSQPVGQSKNLQSVSEPQTGSTLFEQQDQERDPTFTFSGTKFYVKFYATHCTSII